ncbi:MAG: DUF3078 domain-containing protein [Prevotellaceae bacterium]|jgi:hypothetical protein|nr:DUF3078 domain-containing protein [Prevotellaceae bacterium]
MKKITFIVIVYIFGVMGLQAQTADTATIPQYWKLSGSAAINMTQSSYSNWAVGGQNSIAGVLSGGLVLNYKKNKWTWNNTLDAAYGLMIQDESGRSKTDDKIEIASKLGLKAAKKWSYTVLVQFKTQFDKGYKSYPVEDADKGSYTSRFMAPGYLTTSLGMNYNPNADFSLFLSPITMRTTFVQDKMLSDVGSYGVDPGKKSLVEYGAFVKATYQKKMVEDRILLKSKLELFTNWAENPENIDVNFELNIDFKVTKWLSARLYGQMIYYDDVRIPDDNGVLKGPRLQVKQVLGIGLSYIF